MPRIWEGIAPFHGPPNDTSAPVTPLFYLGNTGPTKIDLAEPKGQGVWRLGDSPYPDLLIEHADQLNEQNKEQSVRKRLEPFLVLQSLQTTASQRRTLTPTSAGPFEDGDVIGIDEFVALDAGLAPDIVNQ
ncbi:hypothetical protein ED733_006518 [Metarhizium rileyi]|uniref:Uncharacterized protein n=1 Tax=Metarhizium rileyi (strain RCEF 4871) TaxID=1649241 RepID=A0A5C6GB47_METRR|nr:hypothetical protein ED733_006518 [Metarhizium rileyi]